MYVLVIREQGHYNLMMEEPQCPTPCEPASPRRCFESGSSSVKYVTGHACIGDQVHHGKHKTTGRQRAKTFNNRFYERCRESFRRFKKSFSCFSKSSVDIVSFSNCSDNSVENIQVPTVRSEHASNGSDTSVDKIQLPTVFLCSDTSVDKIPVPTSRSEHASNSSDTIVDEIQVLTHECDPASKGSDTRIDDIPVPTARSVHASESSDTRVDAEIQVPTRECDHVVSNCSDTIQVPTARDNQTEAPMAQCDTITNCDTSLGKQNSSPSPNRRVIRVFHKPVELHHATQPWKPRKDCSTNDLTRKAKAILNKISPENFEKMTKQLKSLNVEDEKDASNLANVLFQKAVEDQTYAYLYAKVCRDLMWSFYIVLEATNPDDFERGVYFHFIVARKAKDEFGKLLQQLTGEPSSSQRRYNRGILNFLAELMNQNVLTKRVAEQDILKALVHHWSINESDHYAIECLCTFLTVAGKALDFPDKQQQAESRRTVDLCYELLQVLAEPKGLLNSRLRFMILDLVELRKNVWVAKH